MNFTVSKDDLNRYKKCLDEIHKRMEVIKTYLKKERTTQYRITNVETYCLQFRKIVELIAMLSLVANKKEYSEKRKMFATDWSARRIFDVLEKVNSKFFPHPFTSLPKFNKLGEKYQDFQPQTKPFLTKEKAIDLYDSVSGFLHAGNPFQDDLLIQSIEPRFLVWYGEIVHLMTKHLIELADGKHMVVGQISTGGKTRVNLFGEVKGVREDFF